MWRPLSPVGASCKVCGVLRVLLVDLASADCNGPPVYKPAGDPRWLRHERPCGSTLADWIEGNDTW